MEHGKPYKAMFPSKLHQYKQGIFGSHSYLSMTYFPHKMQNPSPTKAAGKINQSFKRGTVNEMFVIEALRLELGSPEPI